ncbi:RxLR effector protein Avr1 [Phytophthora ramorum]|uniref:RxLR effector protein Avr1 n=1 Tax=Phytophthora ramorum TaxID=164328 RepID=UPI0030A4A3F9|nr:RxLR effector protein Avr1 [Phytophthora ramorum]
MRLLDHVLLATVVTLLASTYAAAQTKISAVTSHSSPNWGDELVRDRNGASNGRSLRVGTNTVEERAAWLEKLGKNVKVRWWLETEKTDDYVLKALNLKGLRGSDLTTNANYKYFLKFAKKAESYRLNKWLRNDFPTYEAWKELGMQKVLFIEQLNQIKNTKNFRIYKRYVNEFDDYVYRSMMAGYNPPKVMVVSGATKAEMTARVEIMAEAKRSEAYAKVALGLTVPGRPRLTLTGKPLEKHDDYEYFELFLAEAAKMAKTTNKVA